jgi:hypothetical protein
MTTASLSLGFVGDIAFEGPLADRTNAPVFEAVHSKLRRHDLMVANLECVLTNGGSPIPGKCTLRGNPVWARVLRSAGVDVVSLANNHIMDFGAAGLLDTLEALDEAGIRYVGAGRNATEACAPLLVATEHGKVAFISRTGVFVAAPTHATDDRPGVAPFELSEAAEAIRSVRAQVDRVVVLIHWGLEEYDHPSPEQRLTARQLIDAGADAVIGHHPHVLQGHEHYAGGFIAYSLGNFVFNEFDWWLTTAGAPPLKLFSELSEDNRKGVIGSLEWHSGEPAQYIESYTRVAPDGTVVFDQAASRAREAASRNRALSGRYYAPWWRLYAARREWGLRLREQMGGKRVLMNLHRVRPRHVFELFRNLRRSARIVSEKSTSPYQ